MSCVQGSLHLLSSDKRALDLGICDLFVTFKEGCTGGCRSVHFFFIFFLAFFFLVCLISCGVLSFHNLLFDFVLLSLFGGFLLFLAPRGTFFSAGGWLRVARGLFCCRFRIFLAFSVFGLFSFCVSLALLIVCFSLGGFGILILFPGRRADSSAFLRFCLLFPFCGLFFFVVSFWISLRNCGSEIRFKEVLVVFLLWILHEFQDIKGARL
mmetsp:Transcript_5041/g.9503  ORF Transcript_5041/g.9503 Transcript_5041/m.9503 type:complete len:210 (-) Transcript_5041:1163-1792(-)